MCLIRLSDSGPDDVGLVGGKAVALARLETAGLQVPQSLCVPVSWYRRFVERGRLAAVVTLELGRKELEEMRWEELWDAALRIRNRFLRSAFPEEDRRELERTVRRVFGRRPLVVRSSAPAEDSAGSSFAGLHDSYVGVDPAEVAEYVRRVWASLWSDRALLYRRELGLDPEASTMAVLIQELVPGRCSGVAFSVDPSDAARSVIEAVHGLNQGLVDGSVEPDRWFLNRATGAVLEHQPARSRQRMLLDGGAMRVADAAPGAEVLGPGEIAQVHGLLSRVEELMGAPQDVEWTWGEDGLTLLQARPITTGAAAEDRRAWYLSLTRSVDNLKQLRRRIEHELLPAMDAEAARFAARDLTTLSSNQLSDEIEMRQTSYERWVDVYWRDFIPFAHGVRIFGSSYNELLRPEDPYEFMDLLAATPMLSVRRNKALEALADRLRTDPNLAPRLLAGEPADEAFEEEFQRFLSEFGSATVGELQPLAERRQVILLLSELATRPAARVVEAPSEEAFLDRVDARQREMAAGLLELARVSYRLRDDDNIHLAAIKAEVLRAVAEGRRRLEGTAQNLSLEQVVQSLRHPNTVAEPVVAAAPRLEEEGFRVRPRQLVGQPAGPGVAVGTARVVNEPADLFEFRSGEVLVCDAVEPNMTFVVPLAAAVVERRGGMLIHGAIIAREYGLPCVTGVPELTALVTNGERLTVDGFLGIVTVG